jgi:dienelactone hydrolase
VRSACRPGLNTEFIEYYSQTEAVGPGNPSAMQKYFPVWLAEIHSAIEALDKNPAVDPHRVALMGFSLGSFLSLSAGAVDPGQIAAIVEYYGGLPPGLDGGAKLMPPTLILHGDKDVLVSVSQAHALDELLTAANRPHEMHIYEGANHAFNFPQLPFWYNAEDAQDAWNRALKFLAENLKNSDFKSSDSKSAAARNPGTVDCVLAAVIVGARRR